jgi:hypothetical protein
VTEKRAYSEIRREIHKVAGVVLREGDIDNILDSAGPAKKGSWIDRARFRGLQHGDNAQVVSFLDFSLKYGFPDSMDRDYFMDLMARFMTSGKADHWPVRADAGTSKANLFPYQFLYGCGMWEVKVDWKWWETFGKIRKLPKKRSASR